VLSKESDGWVEGFVLFPVDPASFRPVMATPGDSWSIRSGRIRFATKPRRGGRPQRTLAGLLSAGQAYVFNRYGSDADPRRYWNEVWVRACDVIAVRAAIAIDGGRVHVRLMDNMDNNHQAADAAERIRGLVVSLPTEPLSDDEWLSD